VDLSPKARKSMRVVAIAAALLSLLALLMPGTARIGGSEPETGILRSVDRDRTTASASREMLPELDLEEERSLGASGFLGLDRDEPVAEAPDRAGTPLDCLIEPWEQVEIGSPVRGVIDAVYADRADPVEKGQALVQLDAQVEQAAVAVAEARAAAEGQLRTREADLALDLRRSERGHQLYERSALSLQVREELETEAEISRQQLREAREDQRLASLQLDQARAVLAQRTIESPITGVVMDRMMEPGERVDEEPILRVARIDPLRVEVILPAALFGTVRTGVRATVIAEHHEDEVHLAEVTVVDPVIDAASGTFGARLRLPNPDHAIPAGLHCEIRFLEDSEAP
jgi:RND family efflux transporter MFP subunit